LAAWVLLGMSPEEEFSVSDDLSTAKKYGRAALVSTAQDRPDIRVLKASSKRHSLTCGWETHSNRQTLE